MTALEQQLKSLVIDKDYLREQILLLNQQMGFTDDPTATGERAQEMSLALGIRPEENVGSCGIIAARDEE